MVAIVSSGRLLSPRVSSTGYAIVVCHLPARGAMARSPAELTILAAGIEAWSPLDGHDLWLLRLWGTFRRRLASVQYWQWGSQLLPLLLEANDFNRRQLNESCGRAPTLFAVAVSHAVAVAMLRDGGAA